MDGSDIEEQIKHIELLQQMVDQLERNSTIQAQNDAVARAHLPQLPLALAFIPPAWKYHFVVGKYQDLPSTW